ncbi:MAG: MBL fold metallo-hydrolase [Lachnospiraceae bacterium]|nr:MBL fold metallo-hydrolase [Lachnospiraceae bacterium]
MRKEWMPHVEKLKNRTYVYVTSGILAQNTPAIVVGDDCAMALDVTAHARSTAEFAMCVRSEIGKKPIRYMFLTHQHGDHIMGAAGISEAVVICARKLEPLMEERRGRDPVGMELIRVETDGGDRVPRPDILFDKSMTVELGNCRVELMELGHAHTPTDSIAYIPSEGIVACGDLFYNYVIPDGNQCLIENWLTAIDRILSLDADTYIPGHGPVGTREEVLECRRYIQYVADRAREAARRGDDLYEAIMRTDLREWDDWLEPGRLASLFDVAYRVYLGQDPVADLPDWDLNECIDEIRIKHGLPRASLYIPTKKYPYFRRNDKNA